MDCFGSLRQGLPVGHRAVSLVRLPGGVEVGVEVGPDLRLVLGFAQVADGAEAVGVASTART